MAAIITNPRKTRLIIGTSVPATVRLCRTFRTFVEINGSRV